MRALEGLDLRVAGGGVFGLLGPNGAGKTTLVKLVLAIAFPTAGRARVLGRTPGDIAAKARIGYLPENHRYPSHLTGKQVLHYFARLSGLRDPERSRRVASLLKRVRMDAAGDVKVHRYSKGMMQRLGMAQALVNDPELLILDEPTDGVDPVGRREIRDLLLEQKERGTTIFLNSHLLSEVERLCDRVAILKEGRLVREGSVEDLTRPGGSYEVRAHRLRPDGLAALRAGLAGLVVPPPPPPGTAGAGAAGTGAPGPAAPSETLLQLAGDRAALNRLIDALRAQGAEIDAVVPRRQSLEEVFVRVVGEGEP